VPRSSPVVSALRPDGTISAPYGPGAAMAAALLGFFVMTLDALIVNVALPAVGRGFGGGMTGLQWVVDGYTLMFAALLLSAGSVTDKVGARRAFGAGLAVFVVASAACGLAPNLGVLVGARLVQDAGASMIVPASLALIREAYPDSTRRARAIRRRAQRLPATRRCPRRRGLRRPGHPRRRLPRRPAHQPAAGRTRRSVGNRGRPAAAARRAALTPCPCPAVRHREVLFAAVGQGPVSVMGAGPSMHTCPVRARPCHTP
jgi:MFS transporter